MITVNEFLDYVKENGYPQEFDYGLLGQLDGEGDIIEATEVTLDYTGSACAYGQGLLNLWKDQYPDYNFDQIADAFYGEISVDLPTEERFVCTLKENCGITYTNLYNLVVHQNDSHKRNIDEIVEYIRAHVSDEFLHTSFGEV